MSADLKESKIKTQLRQYQNKTLEAFVKEGVTLPRDLARHKMRVDERGPSTNPENHSNYEKAAQGSL